MFRRKASIMERQEFTVDNIAGNDELRFEQVQSVNPDDSATYYAAFIEEPFAVFAPDQDAVEVTGGGYLIVDAHVHPITGILAEDFGRLFRFVEEQGTPAPAEGKQAAAYETDDDEPAPRQIAEVVDPSATKEAVEASDDDDTSDS